MKKKDILFLLASSVILVIAWITFTLIHNISSSTINETLNAQIVPISGNFDIQTINALKKRQQVNALFQTATGSANTQPTIIPTPSLPASESATITPDVSPTQVASQEGSTNP